MSISFIGLVLFIRQYILRIGKFTVQPDCRSPARYFPRGITVNPGGLQYMYFDNFILISGYP